jgi:putative membrane protein
MGINQEKLAWLVFVSGALIFSAIDPVADRLTWFMETVPVMIAIPILLATHSRFPLTLVTVRFIALFALILIIGGFYTYAENPLFNWIQDELDLARNHYDRLGHFIQGVVPALLGRELLLRTSPLQRGKWLFFLLCCVSLAISACYELIEWWTAVVNQQAAEAFLGTQGDNWDAQWDMFMALCGSILSQLTLARSQDRQLSQLAVAVSH